MARGGFAKLKKPLPAPPSDDEIVGNLKEPEDGRSARATGRTHQLATRVREEFYHELRRYAAEHRLKLVEVLEQAFDALKERGSR